MPPSTAGNPAPRPSPRPNTPTHTVKPPPRPRRGVARCCPPWACRRAATFTPGAASPRPCSARWRWTSSCRQRWDWVRSRTWGLAASQRSRACWGRGAAWSRPCVATALAGFVWGWAQCTRRQWGGCIPMCERWSAGPGSAVYPPLPDAHPLRPPPHPPRCARRRDAPRGGAGGVRSGAQGHLVRAHLQGDLRAAAAARHGAPGARAGRAQRVMRAGRVPGRASGGTVPAPPEVAARCAHERSRDCRNGIVSVVHKVLQLACCRLSGRAVVCMLSCACCLHPLRPPPKSRWRTGAPPSSRPPAADYTVGFILRAAPCAPLQIQPNLSIAR